MQYCKEYDSFLAIFGLVVIYGCKKETPDGNVNSVTNKNRKKKLVLRAKFPIIIFFEIRTSVNNLLVVSKLGHLLLLK